MRPIVSGEFGALAWLADGLFATSDTYAPALVNYTWQTSLGSGRRLSFQVSSNLVDWVAPAEATNRGAVINWRHDGISQGQQFFRVRLQ